MEPEENQKQKNNHNIRQVYAVKPGSAPTPPSPALAPSFPFKVIKTSFITEEV